jgi:hypothetical protein
LLHWQSPEKTHGGALYIGDLGGVTFIPYTAVPYSAYDESTGLCFAPRGIGMDVFAGVVTTSVGSQEIPFGVLISFNLRSGGPGCNILLVDKTSAQGTNLFLLLKRNPEESMTWEDAIICLGSADNRLHLRSGRYAVEVRAVVRERVVPMGSGQMRLPALEFVVTNL